jgi:CubicO group peptidase (beta-lactamase class C family)
MDPSILDVLHKRIRRGEFGYVDEMLVIRNGHIVIHERYDQDYVGASAGRDGEPGQYNYYDPNWHPYYHGSDLHSLQSVTKSVASAVIGIAIGRGDLAGVDMPVMDTFDTSTVENLDDRKKSISLEDVLTMRAGIEWDEREYPYSDPRNVAIQMEASEDWVDFVINRPMSHEPGTHFAYSSGASQLLSHILKEQTGKTIDQYAREHLFRRIGIKKFFWKLTPSGLPDTEGGLYLKATDLARIGYLFLHDGEWSGDQILPENWVAASATPYVEGISGSRGSGERAYGYHWWLLPRTDGDTPYYIAGLGYGGQYLFIVPEYQIVAVFTGWNIWGPTPSLIEAFEGYVLRAVRR